MNPGKVVDPYPITENLRLGTGFAPPRLRTHFSYPEDGGNFSHATQRCVGIGNCRRADGGVMCPSFQVLREEKHTTRGRARLLWEMVNGGELELWRDEEVFESLDLCLACKGCTNDCPVSVDLPTLKAEFLAHYYEGRLRPRHAFAFGLIDQAARLASRMPEAVNFLTQTPGLSSLAKCAAGMAPERDFPTFAPLTLRDWFFAREERNPGGPKVILWPDTFNNYLHAGVGVAAVEALEAAGFRVTMPRGHLCCGRPLYDYGMLRLARRYLERVLGALREEIRAGTPVVGIEPSCLAVFKDELPKLLPGDEDGRRLCKQSFHFAEFLQERGEGWEPPPLHRRAILHGHCHHRATGGVETEQKLLERMGVEVEKLETTCCGMAGSWGFEEGHHELSMKIGEHSLLPKVRSAPLEALIVADGFSCKTQIEQSGIGRRALHVAEVLQLAADHGPAGPSGAPESGLRGRPQPSPARRAGHIAAAAAVPLLAGAAAALRSGR